MTNEELCKRLRLLNEVDAFAAADRIEALVREMASGSFYKEADIDALMAERDRAKARLAKAVDALRGIEIYGSDTLSGRTDGPDNRAWQREGVLEITRRARAVLAEIGGETMTDILAPLRGLSNPDVEASIRLGLPPEEAGVAEVLGGTLGTMFFVVILGANGSITASLSCPDRKPTDGQIAAFFRRWGMPLPDTKPITISKGRGLLFGIRQGLSN